MKIDQLETPAIVVDLDRLEANIIRLQRYLDEHRIANRPHIKTHKIPAIARMQIDAGAVGITCQKVSEAEVMADAGCRDIFIPYNIVGEAKLARLMQLAQRATLSVTADSAYTVRGYAAAARFAAEAAKLTAAAKSASAAQQAGLPLAVLVDVDTGMGRCGVQTPQEAAELARLIVQSPELRFGGLMTFPGNEYSDRFVRETRGLLAKDGISIERVSYGGTPTMRQAHERTEVTEYRAGTYVYGDRAAVKSGVMSLDDCSFSVIATVVSRPTADRGILDGGSKTFSSDLHGLEGYGLILEYPEARMYNQSEEHGFVDFSRCPHRPAVGERVTVIPNHCCVVSNLFNQVNGVRGDEIEVVWPVAARGMLQ